MPGTYHIAKASGLKDEEVKRVFEAIAEMALSGERVTIRHFGTFRMKERKPRSFNSPLMGKFSIDANKSLTFSAASNLRTLPIQKSTKKVASKLVKKTQK